MGSGFVLIAKLGEGASGEVWRAEKGPRIAALKIVKPEYAARPRFLRRFQQEIALLAKLSHPGIPAFFEADLEGSRPFVAMEVASGEPLSAWLGAQTEPPPLAVVEAILRGIAAALAHAHQHGVVHRDLKPSNVSWDAGLQRVMVLDLGLAKRIDEVASDQTTAGKVLGTPLYLSPEQVEAKPVSLATDLFALTSIAFELFTLRHAWGRDREDRPLWLRSVIPSQDPFNAPLSIALRILSGLPPRASALRPELPPSLDEALSQGWAKSPAQRPESAPALVELLLAGARGQSIAPRRPPEASTRIGASSGPKLEAVPSETADATLPSTAAPLTHDTLPSQTTPFDHTPPSKTAVAITRPLPAQAAPPPSPAKPGRALLWTGVAAVALGVSYLAWDHAAPPPVRTMPLPSRAEVPAAVTATRAIEARASNPSPSAVTPPAAPPSPSAPPRTANASPKLRPSPRAAPSVSPAVASPAPKSAAPAADPLDALWAGLEANPGDGQRLTTLVEAIQRRAAQLPEARRASIEAAARRALFGGGPAQAKAALDALHRAESVR